MKQSAPHDLDTTPRSGDANEKRRTLILFNVVIMTLMICVDSSIVNVALPVMSEQLGCGMGLIQWVSTSYLLLTCSGILICGRLGDIFGKVRVFMIGVALFTLGSLLCGISPNLPILVAARALQGIGGAAAFANNQGIITEVFPSNERGHALGWIATAASVGSLIGPSLGGIILSVASWGGIFLVNVPIGIFVFALGAKILPNRKPQNPNPLDIPGSMLLFASLLLIVSSVNKLQQTQNAVVFGQLAVGIVLLVAFGFIERRAKFPVVPLSIFRNPSLLLNMFTLFSLFFVIGAEGILFPFYLQNALGMEPGTAALFMTTIPVVTGVVGPIAGAVSDRVGCYIPTCIGLFLAAAGQFLCSMLGLHSPWIQIVLSMAVYGLGSGLFNAPNNSLIMGSAKPDDLGFMGGFAAFARNFGMVLGLTVCTSVLYGSMSAEVGYRVTDYIPGRPEVYMHGMSTVFIIMGIVVFLGFIGTMARYLLMRRELKAADEALR